MKNELLCAAVLAGLASTALAQVEGDVNLEVSNGRIVTGLISEDETEITPGVRVFFGEVGLDVPGVATEPGWRALDGAFAPETPISFDLLGALRRWDGTTFAGGLSDTMSLMFGPASVSTPSDESIVGGFSLSTDIDGGLHDHPAYALSSGAQDGVYLLRLRFTAPGLEASEPAWILFGQNASETDVAAAFAFAETNVPAPGALALAACGAVFARRRR